MAYLDNCEFCKGDILRPGTCSCVIEFGTILEERMKAWKLIFGRKSFPPDINDALQSDMWKAYTTHIARQKEKAERRLKAESLAKRLVKTQEKRISAIVAKKFDFQVLLKFDCQPVMRF